MNRRDALKATAAAVFLPKLPETGRVIGQGYRTPDDALPNYYVAGKGWYAPDGTPLKEPDEYVYSMWCGTYGRPETLMPAGRIS